MNRLRAMGVFCFKVHGGPTMMAGLPDIIACVPVAVDVAVPDGIGLDVQPTLMGIFVGLETKNPDGGDPTPVQQHVHAKIGQAYGRVYVVRSVQDAIDAIHDAGYTDIPADRG
jgi:hypothetical protein